MQLPSELRQRLTDEYRFAVEQMEKTENDPHQQLYFLSVFFGEAIRVLNWQWDSELALLNVVLQAVQQQTATALAKTAAGERVIRITPVFMRALTQAAKELTDWMAQDGTPEQFLAIMSRFAELGYSTTGNGYYLMGRGYIKLEA